MSARCSYCRQELHGSLLVRVHIFGLQQEVAAVGKLSDELVKKYIHKKKSNKSYTKKIYKRKTYAVNFGSFSSCTGISENVHCVAMLPTWVTRVSIIFVCSPEH